MYKYQTFESARPTLLALAVALSHAVSIILCFQFNECQPYPPQDNVNGIKKHENMSERWEKHGKRNENRKHIYLVELVSLFSYFLWGIPL